MYNSPEDLTYKEGQSFDNTNFPSSATVIVRQRKEWKAELMPIMLSYPYTTNTVVS